MSDLLHLPRRVKKSPLPAASTDKAPSAGSAASPSPATSGPKVRFAEPKAAKGKPAPQASVKRRRWPKSDRDSLRIRAVHAASAEHLVEQARRGAMDAVPALKTPQLTHMVERKLAHHKQHLVLSRHVPALMAAPNERLVAGTPPIRPAHGNRWTLTPEGVREAKQIVRSMVFGFFDMRREPSPGPRPLARQDLQSLMRKLQESPSSWLRLVEREPHLLPRMAASLHQVQAVAVVMSRVEAPLLMSVTPKGR